MIHHQQGDVLIIHPVVFLIGNTKHYVIKIQLLKLTSHLIFVFFVLHPFLVKGSRKKNGPFDYAMADYVCKHKCFLYIAVELFLVFPTKHNHYMHEYSVLHCLG